MLYKYMESMYTRIMKHKTKRIIIKVQLHVLRTYSVPANGSCIMDYH